MKREKKTASTQRKMITLIFLRRFFPFVPFQFEEAKNNTEHQSEKEKERANVQQKQQRKKRTDRIREGKTWTREEKKTEYVAIEEIQMKNSGTTK